MTIPRQGSPASAGQSDAIIVLAINCGSSSARIAIYRIANDQKTRLASTHIDDAGLQAPTAAANVLGAVLEDHDVRHIDAVCHRVVHGGTRLTASCWLTPAIEEQILELAALAPLHNPRAVSWMRACRDLLGAKVRQAATFDTAFFANLPRVAATYALPRTLTEADAIRRFGFHGLAHQSMLRAWRDIAEPGDADGRIITIQLGSGCSIAAVRDGRPIDTSMGFTPVEGLVMATRSGDVDPGLLIHLQQHGGLSADELERLLNHESGLLGLSGRSGDMRDLLAAGDDIANLAIDIYCYRVRKYIGAYLAAMNGADAILFGGGVGEHAADVRARILADLDQLGIVLDSEANGQTIGNRGRIDAADSRIAVWVAPVDEEAILVGEVLDLLEPADKGKRHTQER